MNDINVIEKVVKVGLFFVPFLFSLCFHEYAHGWMAKRKGDNTADLMGRLTLNPGAHIDVLGTIILPIAGLLLGGFVFGWAKPVPVNSRNLSKPREDMFWIAFAGPLSNILLAFIGVFVYVGSNHFFGVGQANIIQAHSLKEMLSFFVIINLFLAVFNMIPVHPLDGGKVLARFLPEKWNHFLEANEAQTSQIFTIVLLALIFTGGTRYLMKPAYFMLGIMEMTANALFSLI